MYTLHVRIHSCHYDVSWLNCDGGGNARFTVRKLNSSESNNEKKERTLVQD